MHIYHFGQNEARHIFEPNVSGRGLGMSQAVSIHYAQVTLQAGDRLLFCGKVLNAWQSPLSDPNPSSLEAMRRRLTTITGEDLNAVLLQATEGAGLLNLLKGTAELKEEKVEAPVVAPPVSSSPPRHSGTASTPAHVIQPSAYSIPPQEQAKAESTMNIPLSAGQRAFPSSIPRVGAQPRPAVPASPFIETEKTGVEENKAGNVRSPRQPSENARRVARALAGVIRSTRKLIEIISEKLGKFLPRLLPNSESSEPFVPSNFSMIAIAIIVPVIIAVIAFVVWSKYGRNPQYGAYLSQAKEMRDQAASLANPLEQRESWKNVLLYVDKAEDIYHQTSETIQLRQEADSSLDSLFGITRLQFNPALSSNLGIDISRMAASESDLFLLNAANGEVFHLQVTSNRGFQLDSGFNCKPGEYGSYKVGPLVDILTMPTQNSINATLLGVDAAGNLLYCVPGQIAQAIPLPLPDTNWGRVTAFVLESGNLYVLDTPARAVWVYNGRDGTFIDQPYFFFGGQTPEKQDVIDFVVTGDDLYMLHSDGHLSTCSYSRIESVPTRCQDPSPLVNPFSAYQDMDLFGSAHFTQILFTALPDQSILLLDADAQGVMRFTPRSLELQNQFRPMTGKANPIPQGTVGAVAVSPNHVMYLAVDGQIYFAMMP